MACSNWSEMQVAARLSDRLHHRSKARDLHPLSHLVPRHLHGPCPRSSLLAFLPHPLPQLHPFPCQTLLPNMCPRGIRQSAVRPARYRNHPKKAQLALLRLPLRCLTHARRGPSPAAAWATRQILTWESPVWTQPTVLEFLVAPLTCCCQGMTQLPAACR